MNRDNRNIHIPFFRNLVTQHASDLSKKIPQFATLFNANRTPTDDEFNMLLQEFKHIENIEDKLKAWKKSVKMSVTAKKKKSKKRRKDTTAQQPSLAKAKIINGFKKPILKKLKENSTISPGEIAIAISRIVMPEELLGKLVHEIDNYKF